MWRDQIFIRAIGAANDVPLQVASPVNEPVDPWAGVPRQVQSSYSRGDVW